MARPDANDVVVRQKPGNPSGRFLLGTPATPAQYEVRSRDEAISQALAFAKRQHVQAWLANDEDFVLLGGFNDEANFEGQSRDRKAESRPRG